MRKALFFGDSNTYGYDPSGFMGGRYPRDVRWTTILEERLAQPDGPAQEKPAGPEQEKQDGPAQEKQDGSAQEKPAESEQEKRDAWEIASDGLPGRAIPVTRYEWDYLEYVLRQEMPLDLFAVMLGTNDLLSTLRPDAARTARGMDGLLARAAAILEETGDETSVSARILLIAPPEIHLTDQPGMDAVFSGDAAYAQICYEEGKRLAAFYRELAAYRQILFADASEWNLDFAWDGVHLSEAGHAQFAAQMEKVLRDVSS